MRVTRRLKVSEFFSINWIRDPATQGLPVDESSTDLRILAVKKLTLFLWLVLPDADRTRRIAFANSLLDREKFGLPCKRMSIRVKRTRKFRGRNEEFARNISLKRDILDCPDGKSLHMDGLHAI
jgi:hypothetical protein